MIHASLFWSLIPPTRSRTECSQMFHYGFFSNNNFQHSTHPHDVRHSLIASAVAAINYKTQPLVLAMRCQ